MAYVIKCLCFPPLKEILHHMVQHLEVSIASLDEEITSKTHKLNLLP